MLAEPPPSPAPIHACTCTVRWAAVAEASRRVGRARAVARAARVHGRRHLLPPLVPRACAVAAAWSPRAKRDERAAAVAVAVAVAAAVAAAAAATAAPTSFTYMYIHRRRKRGF